ncbi:MAG: substrate-binding domain-containing protein [Gemmatimonadota bacterium]
MLPCIAACADRTEEIVLASTTSTEDSGLFDVLIPAFERAHAGSAVKVIAVGSGEALALGRNGDADVLLVHSPDDEAAFMRAGHGRRRLPVMHNVFIIAGPPADPVGVGSASDVNEAMRLLHTGRASFVSRGDSSGTYARELRLWRDAGLADAAASSEHRIEVGQGMGQTLMIASERGAYTLTDRGTFVALRDALELDVVFEGDPALRNDYSVITVRDARHPELADVFAEWLTGAAGAAVIRTFGSDPGEPLFVPARDTGS